MTAKSKAKTKRKPPDEDEAQSLRFLEAAAEAAVAGGLSPTEAEREFERTMQKVVSPKPPR